MTPEPDNPRGMGYDPNSYDSSFARLFQRMDTQDATANRIEAKLDIYVAKTDALEKEKWLHRGFSLSGMLAAAHHVITRMSGS